MFLVTTFRFVTFVKLFKFLAPTIGEAGAFMGAHEAPHAKFLDALHEQIGYPQSIKEVTRPLLFLAMVLSQVQKRQNVGVPRLQIDGESSWPLVASLKKEDVMIPSESQLTENTT